MPASAKTSNFDLPQYRNLDTVSMLVTFNGAMQKIDTAMQNIKTTADVGSADIDDLQQSVDRLATEVAALNQGLANTKFKRLDLYTTSLTSPHKHNNSMYNDEGEIILNIAHQAVLNTLTKIPLRNNYVMYSFFSTPLDLWNITEVNTAYYICHAPGFWEQDGVRTVQLFAIGMSRQNNVTYMGICGNNFKETNNYVIGVNCRSFKNYQIPTT